MDYQKQIQEMLVNIKNGIETQQKNRSYEENTSVEQYCLDLQELGIDFTEQMVLDKYKELENFNSVLDYFYYKDQMKWKLIDTKGKANFNSDSQMYFMLKIIEKHYDIKKVLDPFFIDETMYYIETDCPEEKIQEEIMNVMERLIAYANKNDITEVCGIVENYDVNEYLKYYIQDCHNCDCKFKELVQKYYDTFEDADKSIYRIK